MHISRRLIATLIILLFLFSSCAKYATETGRASYYGKGDGFNGKKTANGETFRKRRMTAAHNTLPFNTIVKVKNLKTGKTVKVRINDRGPHAKGRIIDLSYKAAKRLGITDEGTAQVQLKYKKKRS